MKLLIDNRHKNFLHIWILVNMAIVVETTRSSICICVVCIQ